MGTGGTTIVRFWLNPLSTQPTEEQTTAPGAFGGEWLDRILLDFVGRVLS